MDERERKFKELGKWKQIKLIRLAKKVKKNLCNECREGAKSGDFQDYCEECYAKNKQTFDKMHEITGEQ